MRSIKVILSIDGGGIRGILPLVVLDYLNEQVIKSGISTSINAATHLFSGTSTGAIISSALMLKNGDNYLFRPSDLVGLYAHRGPQIFDKGRKEKRNEFPLKLILENNFGSVVMNDLDKCFVFVSYDERSKKPFVFSSRTEQYRNVSLAKVLLACSAVPEYFPPVNLGPFVLSDGIQAAKNPSKLAYEHAKACYPNSLILMLSLGTGKLPKSLFDDVEKRVEETHLELVEMSQVHDDFIYHRIDPALQKANPAMDDTSSSNIQALMDDGKSFIEANKLPLDLMLKDWKRILSY